MASRTATLRLQLIDSVSGNSRNVVNSLKGIDTALARLGRSGSPEVKKLAKQLEYLQRKAGAIEDFTSSRRGLKDMSTELRMAQSNVARLQRVLSTAAKPTKQMESEMNSARNALKLATAAFKDQGAAVRNAERALRSFGVGSRSAIGNSQKEIRSQLAATIREMRRLDHEARKRPPGKPPRQPGGGSAVYDAVVAGGGAYAANAGKSVAQRSFFLGVDFNQAAEYQAALGDFKGDDRSALNKQAEKIGGDTRFSNVDVVRAQTTVLQRGIRDTKTIMDLTNKITDYSLAMGVTLEEGAEAVTGSALSKRVDLKDTKAISNFVDFLVWMAKNGGMSSEDVSQFIKYGGAPTTGAKLPDEYMAAMGMILRNSGVRGDEAGVFARSAASKLTAPTKKGKDALYAMGIDFSKFTSIDSMNAEGIGMMMKNNFGLRLTAAMKDEVKKLIEEGEFMDPETGENRSVISDSGEFSTQMSSILSPLFGKKMSAMDAKALSKALGDYQKYSIDSVDTKALMDAIAAANPGIGNLNAFFTDKQGGRANMIFSKWDEFQRMLGLMQNVPGGVAGKIGTEANQGIYGDWTKLTGTVETALTRVSQDWEFATRPIINTANDVIDGFTNLSASTRRVIEAFVAAAAMFAGVAALRAGAGLVGRMFGGGAAAGAAGGSAAGAAGAAAVGGGLLARGASALSKFVLPLAAATSLGHGSIVKDEKVIAKLREQLGGGGSPGSTSTSDPLRKDLGSATVRWPMMAQMGIRDYVAALSQGGDQAEAKAAEIATAIETELNLVARPEVDTGRLERALGIARQLASALRNEALGGGSAPSGASTPTNTLKFGGPRAKGGSVKRGVSYPVGGSGIEMFTPDQNGTVTPAGRMGGIVINANFNIAAGSPDGQAQQIFSRLSALLNRSGQTTFSGIKGDV